MIHIMGEANQAQTTIDIRLLLDLLDYRMLNCVQDVDSIFDED